MAYRQAPSRWKNQILTALKRDHWYSELDLTKDTIGNDACRTVQANHEVAVFSGGTSIGSISLATEGEKHGYAHPKFSGGNVSDMHISPFLGERMVAVSSQDGQVRVLPVPRPDAEAFDTPIATFRASSTTANTPVLVQFHPQTTGILAIASGTKVDICSIATEKVVASVDVPSPIVAFDWSNDGARVDCVSRDGFVRVYDARSGDEVKSIKLAAPNKPVLRALPGKLFVVSSITRMREREVTLYSLDSDKPVKVWNFGTASTPLIPFVDNARKIIYLLDKSGSTLRWLEAFAPWNEGATSTGVEQSSSACLVNPLGLAVMEGEINKILVASVKTDLVPISVRIGRKSYLEFHDDLFLDVEVATGVSAEDWFSGKDAPAKTASVTPKLVESARRGDDLSSSGSSRPGTATSTSTKAAETTPAKAASQPKTVEQKKPESNGISAREARAFAKLEPKDEEPAPKQVEPKKEVAPAKPAAFAGEAKSVASTPLNDEDELDRLREKKAAASQPTREVYREDLGARRAEYGAGSATATKVSSENKSNGQAQPAQKLPEPKKIVAPTPTREVVRENKTSRRAEYGAVASSASTPSRLAAFLERKKATYAAEDTDESPVRRNDGVYREDLSSRRAEYGAATPKLEHVTQANKEIQRALGNPEPKTPVEEVPVEPYKDKEPQREPSPTVEELENAYAPPVEDSKVQAKKSDAPIEDPVLIVDKEQATASAEPKQKIDPPAPVSTSKAESKPAVKPVEVTAAKAKAADSTPVSTPRKQTTSLGSIDSSSRDYTRKYLTGEMHHPRNSYTSLTCLNASLPNTARMIDATTNTIAIPLAGPGGRIGVVPVDRPGRLPALVNGLVGGAVVVDFELDRFTPGRVVSAHADQAVRVWDVPADFADAEGDIESASKTISGFDRILQIAHHPHAEHLLLVVTSLKLHLVNTAEGKDVKVFPFRGATNAAWSLDGSRIAVAKSDKSVAIVDALSGDEVTAFKSAHQSTRPFRIAFVADGRLITAGFDRSSTREVALYDDSGKVLDTVELDISPSPFALPHYDAMSSILYLTPRGTSTVLPFHVQRDRLVPLTAYSAADPVMGVAFLPPHACDVRRVEVARCFRCSTNEISVVGFYIPRPQGDFFHDDIYPATVRDAYTPALAADDWLAGKSVGNVPTIDLNKDKLKGATSSGVGVAARKPTSTPLATRSKISAAGGSGAGAGRGADEQLSELDQMFAKAKLGGTGADGDEPDDTNTAANTRWD